MNPRISIIIPVYNGQPYLAKTLSCLQNQSFRDFQVIFVDDSSTDGSADFLREVVATDSRLTLLQQPHQGAGAARNYGLTAATGDYILFSDCDDLLQPNALETLYQAACTADADIVACNYAGLDASGRINLQTGVRADLLATSYTIFNYHDCPNDIIRITGSMVWNKLYRRRFILENHLQFDALFTCNDLSFVALSLACAERITYCKEHLIHYYFPRLGNPKNLADVFTAVERTFRKAWMLPHKEEIKDAVLLFGIEHIIGALKKSVKDFSDPEAAAFYQKAHELYQHEDYLAFDPASLNNGTLYQEFSTVQKHDYEAMKLLRSRRIIVSITSYPKRIGTVAKVLETIYAQTKKADEVILWLAEEQFPGKEADLPEDLIQLIQENKLTIRWCDDLKPHKKYFYAFQEYPNDLVITIDDDLQYPPDTISSLYASYLLYPDAISASRVHIMVFNDDHTPAPYNQWIQETDMCVYTPSMQLMATGVGGILYLPTLFRKEIFDKDAIMATCLHADDLWLKAMAVLSDIPVVLSRPNMPLYFMPGSQDDSLFDINVRKGHNDIQLENIIRWSDEKFGAGVLINKIIHPTCGADFIDSNTLFLQTERERRIFRKRNNSLQTNLAETNAALKQLQREHQQLKQTLNYTEKRLKQTQLKLKETEESKPISRQLHALGEPLHKERASGLTPMLLIKFLVYYLAWIPEKLLAAMMYYLQNGMSHTLKHFCDKLLRRK